jgi:cathepsin B
LCKKKKERKKFDARTLARTRMKLIVAVLAVVAIAAARRAVEPEMIAQINAMQKSWTAAENHITRMDIEEARGLLGVDFASLRPLPYVHFSAKQLADVPEAFDSRTNWPQCKTISQIRDQRHCGRSEKQQQQRLVF